MVVDCGLFLSSVTPETLKQVIVASEFVFIINGKHSKRLALCLYDVAGMGHSPACGCKRAVIGRTSLAFVLRDVTRFTVLSPRLEQ